MTLCATNRSGLGGDGKLWRIGMEVYGDRAILPRDVISRKLSVPNAERIFFTGNGNRHCGADLEGRAAVMAALEREFLVLGDGFGGR